MTPAPLPEATPLGCEAPSLASPLVRRLDWQAARAWPPSAAERHHGWILRRNDGEFHRANSVLARHVWPGLDVDSAITAVEARYRAAGLPPTYQISPASRPPTLDERLAERGYHVDDPVHILVRDLAGLRAALPSGNDHVRVETVDQASAFWLDTCWPDSKSPRRCQNGARLLHRIRPPKLFLTAWRGDVPCATGLIVAERGWAGFFCMRTAPEVRRQGLARVILAAAAAGAAAMGSAHCYLQVEAANQPAIALYAEAGFTRAYGYHYRVLGR